jgi:hypothetical protein
VVQAAPFDLAVEDGEVQAGVTAGAGAPLRAVVTEEIDRWPVLVPDLDLWLFVVLRLEPRAGKLSGGWRAPVQRADRR